jgi:GH35 family endo-1,4-beta-xylanase
MCPDALRHSPPVLAGDMHRLACMRIYAALVLVGLSRSLLGCGSLPGTVEPPSSSARTVVAPARPLVLANPNRERVTWPIWGSAFSSKQEIVASVALEPGSGAGLVIGTFYLRWNGTEWRLGEAVGAEAPLQELALGTDRTTRWTIQVGAGGRSIRVVGTGVEGALVTRAPPVHGSLGVSVDLAPGAELRVDELALSQPLPPLGGVPTLEALAVGRGRSMGATSETGDWPPRSDLAFETLYRREFGTAAILDFYWTTTRGEDRDYFFLPADLMVNYAVLNGQRIDGYFLVWDEGLPPWLDELAKGQGAAGLGAAMDEHIATVVGRYRGQVNSWIVVNEAILGPDENDTDDADYHPTLWYQVMGPDYIARAFRDADRADPDARLLYNETGAEMINAKSDFMYGMLGDLLDRGVPIDGVGLQFHIDAAKPYDMASVRRNFERLADLGLAIVITELDINVSRYPGTREQKLRVQAALYAQVVETCLAVPACGTITVFGVSDKAAWDELGPGADPLLLGRDYQRKPAYDAVRDALVGLP